MLMLRRIISGGQVGADQGGLRAGKILGLETSGIVPKGWKTLAGPAPWLGAEYGCYEHTKSDYPSRTAANVWLSSGTVRFAFDFNSPGERCTLKAIKKYGKPCFDVNLADPPPPGKFRRWLETNRVVTLNVAGNARPAETVETLVLYYLVVALRTPNEQE